MRRRPAFTLASTLVGAVVAATLLVACTPDDPEPTGEPTTVETVETTDAPTTTGPPPATTEPALTDDGPTDEATADGPAFPDTIDPQISDATGPSNLVLMDVRVGEHTGFDRVVLEFSGAGALGWNVSYVDPPAITQGAGMPIELEGGAILDIAANGTTYPASQEEYYAGPRQFQPEDGDIEDVYVDGVYEGITQVFVGLDEATVFRVFTLTEPSRLVVDIVND